MAEVEPYMEGLEDELRALSADIGHENDAELALRQEYQVTLLSSREILSLLLRTFTDRYAEIFPIDDIQDMAPDGGDTVQEGRPRGLKRPKHIMDAAWLYNVLKETLREVEQVGSFTPIAKVILEHEALLKRIPECIDHVKNLNAEMHLLRQQKHTEDLQHKEAVLNWNKNLSHKKQANKDLKVQNKITATYRADMAVAKADCKRRVRDDRLRTLRTEIDRLTKLVETEKRVNTLCTDFLKQQNLKLMEEAISLASGHETDVQYMDMMLNKLRDQKIAQQKLFEELEPKYFDEMKMLEELLPIEEKEKKMTIDQMRTFETQRKAAIKIQKIYRGHFTRIKYSAEVKKIIKKRKELKRKARKAKMAALKEAKKNKKGKEAGGKKK